MNMTLILLFSATTSTFQLPPGLLSALCWVESNHNPKAIHKDDGSGNSVGICEIKLETAKLLGFKGTEQGLMDPKVNIYYAGKYLAKQIDRYNGDAIKGIAAYNAGTYRVNAKGLIMNRRYVAKVTKAWKDSR
jgi:soluble lytic murein transglycosylase-like protein